MTRSPLLPCALLVAASSGLAPASAAAEIRIDLEPGATSITFTLGATLHTVEGRVSLSSGALRFDPESGAVRGEIVVDATSADTGNDSRDEDMHTKVLKSGTHPTIVLRPERLAGPFAVQGTSSVELTGRMELAGTSHEIEFPVDVTIEGSAFTATAEFTVPYVEWGLEDPSKFLLRVAKEVEVMVEAEGTITTTGPE